MKFPMTCITSAVCILLLTAATAIAQCNSECGGCNDCNQAAGGGVYQDVVSGDSNTDCGNISDWDDDFFNCCRKSRFDFEFWDPCCTAPYISLFGGATAIENVFAETETGMDMFEQMGFDFVDGYVFGGAIGTRVHQHLRLEIEYSYRYNQAESFFTATEVDGVRTAFAETPATGRIFTHAGMFNVLYDMSRRRIRCPNLYGGGGIGVLTVDADITSGGVNYTSDDSQFAFQFIGGVNFPTSQNVEWFTEYRFLGAEDLDTFNETAGVGFGDVDYDSHSLVFGVRLQR